jgi:predicted amidohydrolase YtcJ
MGYDKVLVPPYRDLTRVDLDKVSTKHPIFVAYLNGHWGSVNSAGLEALEITRDTPTDLVKKRSLRRLFSAG